jgi:very-short-patch-repair endonuclease
VPSPETERARELRNRMTKLEWRVWGRLRGRQLGYKFRRQLPVGRYFVDFVCLAARLAVEIDGSGHDDEGRDVRKSAFLEEHGFRVVRYSAQQVDESLDGVISEIYEELHAPTRPCGPPPRRAGRSGVT